MAVSGLPGLYRMISNRPNGLVVEDLAGGKNVFCSLRKHQFTPLETVAIYTYTDSTEIKVIFNKMRTMAPMTGKESGKDIESYFREVLPEYDEDRVYVSDMKKVIKWFNFLDKHQMLDLSDEEE